jgi:GAF domain-containing protein
MRNFTETPTSRLGVPDSGPDSLSGFGRMMNDSRVLPYALTWRFRKLNELWTWIKSISVLIILALGILSLHSRVPSLDPLPISLSGITLSMTWLTFLIAESVAAISYAIKIIASRKDEEQYRSRRVQIWIAGFELFEYTIFLAFIAIVFGELSLTLALLYLWIIYRVGENGSTDNWVIFLSLVLVSLLFLSALANRLTIDAAGAIIQTWLVLGLWVFVLSLLLFLLRRHVAWRELAAIYQRTLEPGSRELEYTSRTILQALAIRAAGEMGADIIVLYPWNAIDNVPIRPPVVVCRPGVELRNRQYIDTHEIVIQPNNPVLFVIEYYRLHRAPYFSPDARRDERIFRNGKNDHDAENFVVREGIASSIGFPLLLEDGTIVGVMWANYRQTTYWDEDKRRQYSLLCEVLSGLIWAATGRTARARAELMVVLHERVKNPLKLALGQLATMLDEKSGDSKQAEKLKEIEQLTMEAIHWLSMAIGSENEWGLFDRTLLRSALEDVCDSELRHFSGPIPEVHLDDWDDILRHDRSINDEQFKAAYYILRMALRNAIRHSKATNISLSCKQTQDSYSFSVVDNGKGFEVPLPSERQKGGLYLMEALARRASGEVDIKSQPGRGTIVHLTFRQEMQDGAHQKDTLATGR